MKVTNKIKFSNTVDVRIHGIKYEEKEQHCTTVKYDECPKVIFNEKGFSPYLPNPPCPQLPRNNFELAFTVLIGAVITSVLLRRAEGLQLLEPFSPLFELVLEIMRELIQLC